MDGKEVALLAPGFAPSVCDTHQYRHILHLLKLVSSSSLLTGSPSTEIQVNVRVKHLNAAGEPTSVDHRILGCYTELGQIGLNDLEFDGTHATTNEECITFVNGVVCWNL